MKAIFRVGEAADFLGVSIKTIHRWTNSGRLDCFRTIGNHRRITLIELTRVKEGRERKQKVLKPAIYARVSSHEQKQKGDLDRQIQAIQTYCDQNQLQSPVIFKDIGSGLNVKRKGFLKLCQAIEKGNIDTVYITYPDRLTRFGFQYLVNYFASHGSKIQILQQTQELSLEEELTQDLIAIITSFSGRVHGLRSARARLKRQQQKQQITP